MNNQRRKALTKIQEQVDDMWSKLQDLVGELETLKDEEQESFDAMPEGLQQSDRGQQSDQACSALGDAYDQLEQACSSLEEVKSQIEAAVEG